MKILKEFILSVAAGICIAFGGLLNLTCISLGNKIAGSFLFSVGLLLICLCGFNLFTGKVGYFLEKRPKSSYLLDLLIFYVGNFIGAFGTGFLLSKTTLCEAKSEFYKVATNVATHKLVDGNNWLSMLILAIFCGVLVFLAVDLYKREKLHPVVRVLCVILCIGTFVLAGFEHCIADMFYFGISGQLFINAPGALLSILLGSTGNIIGAILTYLVIYKVLKKD